MISGCVESESKITRVQPEALTPAKVTPAVSDNAAVEVKKEVPPPVAAVEVKKEVVPVRVKKTAKVKSASPKRARNNKKKAKVKPSSSKAKRDTDLAKVEATRAEKAAVKAISKFEYGQSRKGLIKVSDLVKKAQGSRQWAAGMEKVMTDLLGSDATLASKEFVCQQLSIIGTNRSVPTLAGMLANKDTSDMARYALERIGKPKAAIALRIPRTVNPLRSPMILFSCLAAMILHVSNEPFMSSI